MLPKVVRHNEAHELFMNRYGRRRSTVLLASERSERDTIRGNKWKSEIYLYVIVTRNVLCVSTDGERGSPTIAWSVGSLV